jgi:hypothetical protein
MSGHTVETLLSTYAHPIKEAARAAADKLGAGWQREPAGVTVRSIADGQPA